MTLLHLSLVSGVCPGVAGGATEGGPLRGTRLLPGGGVCVGGVNVGNGRMTGVAAGK